MKYDIIYCDIPWKFSCYSEKGEGRSAANHYPTLDLESVKALPVKDIASDNSALFMWGCNSMPPEALEVMKAWGFQYKTVAFTWVKTNKKATDTLFWGLGFHSRQNSEFCLLGTRGHPKRISKSVHSVVWDHEPDSFPEYDSLPESIVCPITRHSAKPLAVRDRIVELLGPLPRVELFARPSPDLEFKDGIQDGWRLVGNEVDGLDIRAALQNLLSEPLSEDG